MKKFIVALVLGFMLCCGLGYAQEAYTDDHSIVVDLGEGNGAVIIVGNNNVVYLPPVQDDTLQENSAVVLDDGTAVLVLGPTKVNFNGIEVLYKRIVIGIGANGIAVVLSAEQ